MTARRRPKNAWFDDPAQLRGRAFENDRRAKFWDGLDIADKAAVERQKRDIYIRRAQMLEGAGIEP
jgi:hypothetical protein